MAISLASMRRSTSLRPPVLVVYGVEGVGKTSFAASAPNPAFILTEDGLGSNGSYVDAFPKAQSYEEVREMIGALAVEPHEFQTCVIDTLDHLEPLIWRRVCTDRGVKNIEDIGYGKGYAAALDIWREFLDGVMTLRDERNMAVIMLAHSAIKRFDSPETEPYDRYIVKLHEKASALVRELCDGVLFANYRTSVVKTDVGFKKSVARAVGGGERLLHTSERPAFMAKNRFSLPETLPLSWQAFSDAVAANTPQPQAA